jgi:hypothetical protein
VRMASTETLSPTSRVLTYLAAGAFAALGLVLFLAPDWSAERFPWAVSSIVAMTAGAWCLGTALFAWLAARDWRWSVVYGCLMYVWAFGLLQLAVVLWHVDGLRLDVALAWPYLLTLGIAVAALVVGITDLFRLRPALERRGPRVPGWITAVVVAFVLFVAFLAIVAVAAPPGAMAGSVFPDRLTLFTLRAFGAFYLALGIGAAPLTRARGLAPIVALMWAGIGLIVPILVATAVFAERFNFERRPLGALYIGAYVAALIGAAAIIAYDRAARRSRG